MRSLRSCWIFLLAALVAGCSAAGSPPATPNAGALPPPAHRVKASIRITVPKHTHLHRARVRGHYVSPATQSIAISITPQAGGTPIPENVDLAPANNPDCTASLVSPTICTVAFTLAPGLYTAAFTTYDGPLAGGNAVGNPPTGNKLSANVDATLDVVAGQGNQLDVTLDGIPVSAAIVPAPNSTLSGNVASGYTLSKCAGAQPVSVVGVDADLNYIVGAGAPSVGLVSNGASLVVATPPPTSPNLFTLTRSGIPRAGSQVALTASVQAGADSGVASPVTTQVDVNFNDDICGVITEFRNISSAPQQITSGPDGDLWFTDSGYGAVVAITTTGTMARLITSNVDGAPDAITVGPDDNLWFTSTTTDFGSNIYRVTTGGSISEFSIGVTGNPQMDGIVAGSDGSLWSTEYNGSAVDATTTNLAEANGILVSGNQEPRGIASGPDGNLWFTLCAAGEIGVGSTGGSLLNEFSMPSGNAYPYGIANGPDGNLWFTESGANKIGRITTLGTITEFTTATLYSPRGVTAGADGNLWFADYNGANPGAIGRITTNGTITEFTTGLTRSPSSITLGADKNLWFTEPAGGIGRMQ